MEIRSMEDILSETKTSSHYVGFLNSTESEYHKDAYKYLGEPFEWPSEGTSDPQPDWRVTTFSLIFPIEENAFANAQQDDQGFLILDDKEWEGGRYHGVQKLTFPNRTEKKTKEFKAFHHQASRRFHDSFYQSIGGPESLPGKDANRDPDGDNLESFNGPKFCFRNRPIKPIANLTEFELGPQNFLTRTPKHRLTTNPLRDFYDLPTLSFCNIPTSLLFLNMQLMSKTEGDVIVPRASTATLTISYFIWRQETAATMSYRKYLRCFTVRETS